MAETGEIHMTREEVIAELTKLKEQGLDVILHYDGGGDSGEYHLTIGGKKVGWNEDNPLAKYLFDAFDGHFYVNSDGHYEGEAGQVTIDLERECMVKSGYSNWTESMNVKRVNKEAEMLYITKFMSLFLGDTWGSSRISDTSVVSCRYNLDCVLSEEEISRIHSAAERFRQIYDEIADTLNDLDGNDEYTRVTLEREDEVPIISIDYYIREQREEEEIIPL